MTFQGTFFLFLFFYFFIFLFFIFILVHERDSYSKVVGSGEE